MFNLKSQNQLGRSKRAQKRALLSIVSITLSLLLISSISAIALEAEVTPISAPISAPINTAAVDGKINERLAEVTLIVKNKLDIDDHYTNFYGSLLDKSIREMWTLNWSAEGESLNVSADGSGKIYYYSRYIDNADYRYSNDFAPKFPSVTREQARTVAEAFLDKVLDNNESCDLSQTNPYDIAFDVESYYFNSVLKINDLDTPIDISIRVSSSDLSVSYFRRGDQYTVYMDDIPSNVPVTSKEEAFGLLVGTVQMKLEYVPDHGGKDEPVKAVLRYLPISTGNYVVNAKTGELINITELLEDITRDGGLAGAGADMAVAENDATAQKSLTETELMGISKLEGVLNREELDSKAKQITEFGIDSDYVLNEVNYYLNTDTDEVFAYLTYYKRVVPSEDSDDRNVSYSYKRLTLDAKSGDIVSLSTSYGGGDYSKIERDRDALQKKAEAFLQKYFNQHFVKTDLYEDTGYAIPYPELYYRYYPSESYVFSQKENGYFFPTNSLHISVNAETGTIDSFYKNWNENVVFDLADGIISNDTACAAYAKAHETKLSYVALPVQVDPSHPDLIRYAELGYSYIYELILGYTNVTDKYIIGVDAKTGEVISMDYRQTTKSFEYDDIAGHYAEKQILKLAEHGVGYPGKSFKPSEKLTQLDMVLLFLSADGYRIDTDGLTDEQINEVYNAAYSRNIIRKDEKDSKKLMTRAEVLRAILRMSGYDKTADLKGIYKCNFSDASSIKEADFGYFAIAQGLGVIRGDSKGNANPYSTITRVEAALMLYNFMSR
jgi:hypothetical protein